MTVELCEACSCSCVSTCFANSSDTVEVNPHAQTFAGSMAAPALLKSSRSYASDKLAVIAFSRSKLPQNTVPEPQFRTLGAPQCLNSLSP